MRTDICTMLKDRFPFAGRMTTLSDLASSAGIAGDSSLGINSVFVSHNRGHLHLTDRMCLLEFLTDDEKPICGDLESHHFPHGIEQSFRSDSLTCRAFTCFDTLNTPVVHLEILPTRDQSLIISVSGGILERADASGEYEFDRATGILYLRRTEPRTDHRDPEPVFNLCVAVKPSFSVREALLADSTTASIPSGSVGSGAFEYRLLSDSINLVAGEPFRACVALTVAVRDPDYRRCSCERFSSIVPDLATAEKAARDRTNSVFISAPAPDTDNPRLRELYYHSICVLRRNLHYPTGLFGSHYACFPCKDNYDAHWLWDGAFHAVGFSEFDARLAKDSVLILTENQLPNGRIPHFVTADWLRPGDDSQPPVLGWAAWKVYKRTCDMDFLRTVYDSLVRNTEWWMRCRDLDCDGLLEWAHRLESGWDNSPRWDSEFGKLETCDLNAFVLAQMNTLATMAEELGYTDEASRWRSEADEMGNRIVAKLYQPNENLFRDIRYDTHEPADIMTLASFLPLWAGVPLDHDRARAMIRDYLLNPEYFWGEVPFPVVAYCDPKYDSANFWRGPSWIHFGYMMAELLVRYDFRDEAEEAVRRLLDVGTSNTYIHEYYDSRTGEGRGVPEYGWSAAFFIEMLLRRYRE